MNIIAAIVTLIIIGVLVWAARAVLAHIPMEGWLKSLTDTVILVVAVLAAVFYVLVPLLTSFAGHLPFH